MKKQMEFSKLKHAYINVKSFKEHEYRSTIKSLGTKIQEDLGLWGDDNLDLIENFINKFDLEYDNFITINISIPRVNYSVLLQL